MYVNNRCVGCSQCLAFCRHHAISVRGRAVISDNCKACRICISYCPMKAISKAAESETDVKI
ncbi:MAG: 4Fe-4S binding protein [Methanimicrococcus sp.]|nr:4Fe-4S binding protein [Methanimicrococcus sp.]